MNSVKSDKNTYDNRIRKTVYPTRIIKTFGNVQNADSLLKEKSNQINLLEPDCVTIENDETNGNSGVLLDFGTEINGTVRIMTFSSHSSSPAKVHITYGESVSEALSKIGKKNATNDHAVRDFDCLLPSYSDISFNETGFRFVCIRLKGKTGKITIKSVTAVSIYRDIEYKGSFSCSNETLNKIYNTAAYTCHLCMQNYIYDGIKRDRLVWIGDLHPEMLTVRSVFGDIPIMKETLNLIRCSTPLPGWMNNLPTYSLWWLIIVKDWYFYSGDREFIDENEEYIKALTDQILGIVDSDGKDCLNTYFLDWPTYGTPAAVQGSRALLVIALGAASELASVFGLKELSDRCKAKIRILNNCEWSFCDSKQTAAFISLAGYCNNKEAADFILKDNAKGFSTFMSYYLLKSACKSDMCKTLDILEEYYGGMLSLGATSFWEDFDIEWLENSGRIDEIIPKGKTDPHGDNGAFCYKGFRHSLCHGWSSAPAAFLMEEVLGIHILTTGCRSVEIKPNLGNLEWAKGTYPTPQGIICISCKKMPDGSVSVNYTAPDGIKIVVNK